MKFKLRSFSKYLTPTQSIAGLELTDTFLRFLKIEKNNKVKEFSLRLPPGIIEQGKVKDINKLISALNQLRQQLKLGFKNTPLVVTIGANNIYTQVFNLPYLALSKIQEAAKLNLQMISPIDIKNVYADWQIIGENLSGGGQLELLGAFVRSEVADQFLTALQATNFSVVALEFAPLSFVRSIKKLFPDLDISKLYIFILASNEGLDFIVLKNGNLYFSRFINWPPPADLKNVFGGELQKVINFYYGKWGEIIGNIILITPQPMPEIDNVITDLKLNVQKLSFKEITPSSIVVMGAALRGLIPRAEDNLISLTNLGTEEEYYRNRTFYFVDAWRNITITSIGLFLIIFTVSYLFLINTEKNLNNKVAYRVENGEMKKLTELEEMAKNFNELIRQATIAKEKSVNWLPILTNLLNKTNNTVVISRLHFTPANNNEILISGHSLNELEIINFKNRLIKDRNYEKISLPLSQIIRDGNLITFQMSLKIKG